MHLQALSIGYAVPRANFEASVHSIFRTAINLKPVDQNLLLTMVAVSEPDLPQGVRIDCPADFSFERADLGWSASSHDGCLFFEGSTLEIEFRNCRRWQCDLPAYKTDLTEPAVAQAWKWAWELLNARQLSMGTEIVAGALLRPDGIDRPAISIRLGEAVREVNLAMRNHRPADRSALTRLMGLGGGLTPSGDDFLVGYLAGLWCSVRDNTHRRRLVAQLGQLINRLSGRTTDISRTYLYHAACGQVCSRLDALARAISTPESQAQILAAAELAMHSGHSSGMDAVTGLLFGLACWDGETLPTAG